MLMNISEKINNSKYNMPLKRWKERKRKSHFYFKTKFWFNWKTQSGELAGIYANQHCEFICNLKLFSDRFRADSVFMNSHTKFISQRRGKGEFDGSLAAKSPRKCEIMHSLTISLHKEIIILEGLLCGASRCGLRNVPSHSTWYQNSSINDLIAIEKMLHSALNCSNYLNVYHSAPRHIINLWCSDVLTLIWINIKRVEL